MSDNSNSDILTSAEKKYLNNEDEIKYLAKVAVTRLIVTS
jgi:hypothetical protein